MSTIDPGIEEQISRSAEDIESQPRIEKQAAQDEDLTIPTEWWFASTASPLLAATFGPVANGFSICALVYPWREYIPPGGTPASGSKIPDPHWLIAINAVSLAFALIGNITLLLNMAKRLNFSVAQPMTITGFLVAGILLIADMAALSASPTYWITDPQAIPAVNHALTSAFYYAIWAAGIYTIITALMCLTVYGANSGHYKKDFALTAAQRTLMLQTMSFMAYLLIGAVVFSHIENWKYLDGVYWAQVTLLTIGFGDYSPQTDLGRGLFFPYAIGGILTVGMVVGSIRSLVLERGKEKIAARITEKRREGAVHNVDGRQQTIKVSLFARADFSTDPKLTPAQRREEEFHVMRKVQKAAERERRYMGLSSSLFFALLLWFVGAAIFMVCERESKWTYFQALYFTFVALLTIGYGDFTPSSNAGKAFFVLWSLLAVPSLTILISNMGDTIVKWVADLTDWLASFTVLPERGGAKRTSSTILERFTDRATDAVSRFTAPGLLGMNRHEPRIDGHQHYNDMLDSLSRRLEVHIEQEELDAAMKAEKEGELLDSDIHFYNYVLSREVRNLQKDLSLSPPKEYTWHDWEYYLKLMGNEDDAPDMEDQQRSDALIPEALRVVQPLDGDLGIDVAPRSCALRFPDPNATIPTQPTSSKSESDSTGSPSDSRTALDAGVDGVVDRQTEKKDKYAWHGPTRFRRHPSVDPLSEWSWLSEESPLMSTKSESEWILERLSAALVRELNRQRRGCKRQPPISMRHVLMASEMRDKRKQAGETGVKGGER